MINDEEHVMDSRTNFISFRNKNKFSVYIERPSSGMTERKRYKKRKAINTKEKEIEGRRERGRGSMQRPKRPNKEGKNPSAPPLSFIT